MGMLMILLAAARAAAFSSSRANSSLSLGVNVFKYVVLKSPALNCLSIIIA